MIKIKETRKQPKLTIAFVIKKRQQKSLAKYQKDFEIKKKKYKKQAL